MKNKNPISTIAWEKLQKHYDEIKHSSIQKLFNEDIDRVNLLSVDWDDFYVDFSKNKITNQTLKLLENLAEELSLKEAIEDYFLGVKINQTEERSVLHTALRADNQTPVYCDGENLLPKITAVKNKIQKLSEAIISGKKKGFTKKVFTDIVNVGIGGSDLGPSMTVEALKFYKNHLNTHFISNVDGDHLQETLKKLNPETTLFIIVSKTFTTQETITNATTIREWFLKSASENDISSHFIAVSANIEQAEHFGITPDNIFPMWKWVGGRFSLWSAVGLCISLSVGFENYSKLLEGARSMDNHFRTAPFKLNIPVILGFLSVWYNNFFGAESEVVIPYTQYLDRFVPYLQQLAMESNGKSVDRDGHKVNYQTGNIIWGGLGTNSQHAFFQLLHQGTKLVPMDFIGFKTPLHKNLNHHHKLMSNFFAQTESFLLGKTEFQVREDLESKNFPIESMEKLVPFKIFDGDKPTNTILINKLTPHNLGALIAMYEHKIFVQGVIWNIYSYDQWGVELGKEMANNTLNEIKGGKVSFHDPSTTNLLKKFNNSNT